MRPMIETPHCNSPSICQALILRTRYRRSWVIISVLQIIGIAACGSDEGESVQPGLTCPSSTATDVLLTSAPGTESHHPGETCLSGCHDGSKNGPVLTAA